MVVVTDGGGGGGGGSGNGSEPRGGSCSSAGSPRTTRTRHWPTTLDLASSLLFPASLMHYTRLSGYVRAIPSLLSFFLLALPSSRFAASI